MYQFIATYKGTKKFQTKMAFRIKATWEDENGYIYYSNYNKIIFALNPSIGDIFKITCKELSVREIRFPIEFEGINNSKHYIYDTRQQKLVPKGEQIETKVLIDRDKKLLGLYFFEGFYQGVDKIGGSSNTRYHMFRPKDNQVFKYLYISHRNNALKYFSHSGYKNEFKILFSRELYLHAMDFGNYNGEENWKCAIGEFPVLITNLTLKLTYIYNQVKQTYQEHELITNDLEEEYLKIYPSWQKNRQ